MRPIATDVAWFVCVTTVSSTRTADVADPPTAKAPFSDIFRHASGGYTQRYSQEGRTWRCGCRSTRRRTTLGDRAFPVTAARAWNALPSSVRSAPSSLQFRRDLNITYSFNEKMT